MQITDLYEFYNSTINFLVSIQEAFISPYQILLLIINLIIYFSASTIIKKLYNDEDDKNIIKEKTKLFTFFSLILITLQASNVVVQNLSKPILEFLEVEENFTIIASNAISSISISIIYIYASIFLYHVFSIYIVRNFGKTEIKKEKKVMVSNYKTRLMKVFLLMSVSFFNLVLIINLWHFESILGTSGIIGMLLGFVALTAGIWGHDLYDGMVMIYSKLMEEEGLIKFDGEFYIVYKVTPFETMLSHIDSNKRTVMRNKLLGSKIIENITNPSHSQGFRVSYEYKIGYPVDYSLDSNKRLEQHDDLFKNIEKVITSTQNTCIEDDLIDINSMYPIEVLLKEAGDFALHYKVSFYLNTPEKTKSTVQARKFLRSKELFNAIFYRNCVKYGIDLSTPTIYSKA